MLLEVLIFLIFSNDHIRTGSTNVQIRTTGSKWLSMYLIIVLFWMNKRILCVLTNFLRSFRPEAMGT